MAESWGTLFERATKEEASLAQIRAALTTRRENGIQRARADTTQFHDERQDSDEADGDEPRHGESNGDKPDGGRSQRTHEFDQPDPARVVADADVLAADLLVGGDARDALDHVRRHSWVELVASDVLLADAHAVIECVGGATLAEDWREHVASSRVGVIHPVGDHPALASAHHAGAAHVLAFEERLRSVETGARLRARTPISVKHPRAFARLFDPESLYHVVVGGEYPGPDHDDPRS